eukprot:SAG22_NODE_1221_length_5129_cov_18.963419_3_plen_65_part_00
MAHRARLWNTPCALVVMLPLWVIGRRGRTIGPSLDLVYKQLPLREKMRVYGHDLFYVFELECLL